MKKILCILMAMAVFSCGFSCFAYDTFLSQTSVQGMEGSMAGLLNSGYRGDSGIMKTDTFKYAGNYSWQMPATAATTNYHIQISAIPGGMTLSSGKSYYFSAYMMAPDTACDVKILAMTGAGGSSSVAIVPNGTYQYSAGEWGHISGVFTIPENVSSFLNCLRVVVPKQPETGYIYMDEIFVGEIELQELEITSQFTQDEEDPSKGSVIATAGMELSAITSVTVTPTATVSDVCLADDGTTITFDVSNLSGFTDYTVAYHAIDTLGRAVSAETTFTSGRVPTVPKSWSATFDSAEHIPDKIKTDKSVAAWSSEEGASALGSLMFTSGEAAASGYGKVDLLNYFKELGFSYTRGAVYEVSLSFLHKNNDSTKRQIFLGMAENQVVKGSFEANVWHNISYRVTASAEQLLVMNWNGNEINGDVTYLDDITIKEILPFRVTSSDSGSDTVPFASGSYALSFSLSMEALILEENVRIDGGAEITSISGDGYDYVLNLTGLQPDKQYEISFVDITDSQGQELTETISFRTLKKFEITKSFTNGTALVTIKNNTAQSVEIAVNVLSFRGETLKYFVGIAMDKKMVAAGSTESFSATLPFDRRGTSQKIFIRNWAELSPIQ